MALIPLAMPVAGLSFADVSLAALECRGNRVRTAKRLGVGVRSLDAAIDREGLHRWFISADWRVGPKGVAGSRFRRRCVTREQVVDLAAEGYLKSDAADILGISEAYLKDLIRSWKITEFNSDRSRSVKIGLHGYAR